MEPLWDRVDRNRVRLGLFVVLFVVGSVAGFDLMILAPVMLFLAVKVFASAPASEAYAALQSIALAGSAAFGGLATVWAGFTLLRSEKWLLAKLGAELVPKGSLLDTKFALKDMAIAAGLDVAPALYRIPDSSVNAFIFAARRRRAVVGVTQGFVEKLTVDEQRAVFANLVARLRSGDTITSTGVTALMAPVHSWRDYTLTSDDREMSDALGEYRDGGDVPVRKPDEGLAFLVIFGFGFALLAEIVAAGHRRAQLSSAEKADAEGMLLLKDPASMLSALEKCVPLNNGVPAAGEALAEVFYCWTADSTNDDDDPVWQRVARLREVLGVAGWRPESEHVVDGMFAPPPPRLANASSDDAIRR